MQDAPLGIEPTLPAPPRALTKTRARPDDAEARRLDEDSRREKNWKRPFLPDASGRRPVHDGDDRYGADPNWRDLVLFYE
jgi:hypothetical protein